MPPLNGISTDQTIAGITGNNTAGVPGNNTGESQGGFGVFGRADGPSGTGVVGASSTLHGVHGVNGNGSPANPPLIAAGVWGETDNGFGVYGNSEANNGVTCLINERVALDSAGVRQAFAARGIVALKGDWISPVILPQILIAPTIIDALGKV